MPARTSGHAIRPTAAVNVVSMRPDDRVAAVIDTRDYESYRYLLIATKNGMVKKTPFREYDSSRREGIIAINLKEGDEVLVKCIEVQRDGKIRLSRKEALGKTIADLDAQEAGNR